MVTETLRLYPSVWLLARVATGRATLGGQVLPAGTNVFYSPYLIHRLPRQYSEPDRWLNASSGCPGSFLAFGEGARKCAGDAFALTQLMVMVAGLMRRWQLVPTAERRPPPAARAVLQPRHQRLVLNRREKV